jgi:hypothetical protein
LNFTSSQISSQILACEQALFELSLKIQRACSQASQISNCKSNLVYNALLDQNCLKKVKKYYGRDYVGLNADLNLG